MFTELAVAIITAASAIAVAVIAHRRHQPEPPPPELLTQSAAEEVILDLLREREPKRTFAVIKKRLGGFTDAELRDMLVRVGAVSFTARDGRELWGLRDRNRI